MMRFRFSTSSKKKKKKILAPDSEDPVPLDTGSKEEIFFDSQAWIDSDCEDEFLSVNGDFTPRSSFSDHQNSSTENTELKAPDFNSKPSLSSPTNKKMKLSELLNESLGGDEIYDDQTKRGGEVESTPDTPIQPSKTTKGISHLFTSLSRSTSTRSSDRTPNKFSKYEKEKSTKTPQCCLPRLITSLSFSERKKKLSPDFSGG